MPDTPRTVIYFLAKTQEDDPVTGGGGATYDQASEPTASTGETWVERNSGTDLIEGHWIWDGTQWLSVDVYIEHMYSTATSYSSPFITYNSSAILLERFVYVVTSNNSGNNDASNFVTYELRRKNNVALSETVVATVTSEALTSGRNLTLSATVNQTFLASSIDAFLLRQSVTGTPQEVVQGSGMIIFRLVR